jgi:hypothetical protein
MDSLIIGIYGKHHQYFTQNEITAKEKSTKLVILVPGFMAKIWTMIGCSNIAAETTPWMVCSSCISTFPVDAGATHLHAKRWWECVAVYDLPGVGAVPFSAVNMGDGSLSAETGHVASGTAHKAQRRWWEFWKSKEP